MFSGSVKVQLNEAFQDKFLKCSTKRRAFEGIAEVLPHAKDEHHGPDQVSICKDDGAESRQHTLKRCVAWVNLPPFPSGDSAEIRGQNETKHERAGI